MDYENFKEEFIGRVRDELEEKGINFEERDVLKTNGQHLDGLVVSKDDARICPTVYVNGYYDDYMMGARMGLLVERIIDAIEDALDKLPEVPQFTREFVEQNLFAKVINVAANKELLEQTPHRLVQDLAVIPCVAVNSQYGNASAKLTNDMLSVIKMTKDEVLQKAIENTEKQEFKCVSMAQMLMGMIKSDFEPEESEEFLDELVASEKERSMFVVLNEAQNNGAAILACKGSLEKAVQEVGEDCYVLPSSIFEVILVPKSQINDPQVLIDMVRDINRTQVAPGEVLSDNVYQYDLMSKKLSMVTGEELEEVVQPKRAMSHRI